jgi:DNA-directed RNA polymerase specialized sigma24 family protein
VFGFGKANKEKAAIQRIFKGHQDAFRLIVEQYQPVVYAIALAHSGNVVVADRIVVASFRQAFERLVSLTDAKRLGHWLCALTHKEAEVFAGLRGHDRLKPRDRDPSAKLVDLGWLQSEFVEPLSEELAAFSLQERKGVLLNALCGAPAPTVAAYLKIEVKEAAGDLARIREKVGKKFLRELAGALAPEINSKERMVHIMREVAGDAAAIKASRETRLGRSKGRGLHLFMGAAAVLLLAVAGHFVHTTFFAPTGESPFQTPSATSSASGPDTSSSSAPQDAAPVPANYSIQGRVVDRRFGNGIPGLTASTGDKSAETDSFGGFEIKNMVRGEYEVVISHQGETLSKGNIMHTEKRNAKIQIDVTDKVPARFTFRGRVTDAKTGQVIPDFETAACKDAQQMMPPYLLNEFQPQSNPDGLLLDRYVTYGTYTLYVRAQGYAPLPSTVAIGDGWGNDTVHELRLLRSATIQGRVYGANELTLQDARIMPREGNPESLARSRIYYTTSDAGGSFSIFSLPVGVNWFLIDHRSGGIAHAVVVTEPGKVAEVKIQMPKKGSLAGDITVDGYPSKFSQFRVASGMVAGSRTVEPQYNAPGAYEVPKLPPGNLTILANVAPADNSPWFERVYERAAALDLSQPTWLDFNYATGANKLSGAVTLRGAAPKAAFVEVKLFRPDAANIEHLYYDIGAAGTFTAENLPVGKGEVTVYCSGKAVGRQDFSASRGSMEKSTKPFEFVEAREIRLDFAL